MRLKSLTAGAALALSATPVFAADLPAAPEPVDYVRVCDAWGAGFFYVPGSETCLQLSGYVRTEARIFDMASKGGNAWDDNGDVSDGFRARGVVNFDARTNTEFGLLRSYISIMATSDSGADDAFALDKAFIQWGGITAGRAGSFYDFYTGANWGAVLNAGFADDGTVNLFAYTAAFGNGFSATLSVEDGINRRAGVAGITGGAIDTARQAFGATASMVDYYGGHRIPDFVANLRVDQGWGSAQIMGALHQVILDENQFGALGLNKQTALGWAIGAGMTFNLPMISSGTTVGFQAAYSDGAANYAAAGNGSQTGAGGNYVDAVTDGVTIKTTKSWAVGGGLSHAWSSTLSSGLTGSYISYDHGLGVQDLKQYNVQGNLVWTPVSGLSVGAELEYSNSQYSRGIGGLRDTDALVGVFRMQRSF